MEAFSGIAHTQLTVVLRKLLADSLMDSCSLDARGGTEDRSFLQGLQPLSLSQTGAFGWSLPAPFGNSFSDGYHTSQDWCRGSQNKLCFGERPASGLAHSRHPARELGAPPVLQERISLRDFPTCVEQAGLCWTPGLQSGPGRRGLEGAPTLGH